MMTCDCCEVLACKSHKLDDMPANCPMKERDSYTPLMQEYGKEENAEFFTTCANKTNVSEPFNFPSWFYILGIMVSILVLLANAIYRLVW